VNWLKYFFEIQYRFSKPRWDTNITPPEVVETIERGTVKPGRALDLGCGTGTNAIYLARAGFEVVGVDFSPKAIAAARAKARRANIAMDLHTGDVTRLEFLREPFDLVLDIGCFHSVEPSRRKNYAAEIARLTQPGAWFMLYAFTPRPMFLRQVGATVEEVKQTFGENFALERVAQGVDRGELASAWFWFRRR
jgi:cyclopropane fatty-acyl-phospholipid synthase-like methyltransferase